MLICPICKNTLNKLEKSFVCQNNHCFDISKSSHTNLLISSKSGDDIGDNKEMVRSRTSFLNKDYYKPLALKLCELLPKNSDITYLDCGCGQGYYTSQISNFLKNSKAYATDISKHAIMYAAKHDKNTTYFVGSVFDLPIANSSIDVITSLFAPLSLSEFGRVIKDDGTIIIVVSGENHLFELKQAIYDNPYKNDEDKYDFGDLTVKSKEKLTYKVCIEQNDDIKQLFFMTPYAFKTSKEDTLKLDNLQNLEVTLDFGIYILTNTQ